MRTLLAACCASFLTFGSLPAQAQGTARLSGRVQDATTSRPLIGATVTLGTRTTWTDETGAFAFARVVPGTYQLIVRSLGYAPSSQGLVVTGDMPVEISLTRVATLDTMRVRAARQGIYGVVATWKDLTPLANASVQVFGTSSGEATTDSTGHFFYAVKTPGAYLVRARVPGRATQTMSVTVQPDDGVEIALLLDSLAAPGANALEMAFGDFRSRLIRRSGASALVPRSELAKDGDEDMVGALLGARSFRMKSLRFSDVACVFVDGAPRPGMSINAIDAEDVEMIETYSASADRSGTLAQLWPRGMPCADTGMPRAGEQANRDRQSNVVRWIVVWMKH